MRLLGIILALGALCWVLYRAAGGGEEETAVPAEYQESLNQAKDVEQALRDASQKSMEEAEKQMP